jgi:agmatine deiminase
VLDVDKYFQPAEWAPHRAVWLAWPGNADLWRDHLESAQSEFLAFCEAIVQGEGESLEILVPSETVQRAIAPRFAKWTTRFHVIPYGDIWLRDTAPIFLKSNDGKSACVRFGFNGWGKKYVLPHDSEVAAAIANVSRQLCFQENLILEGGSVEVDGEGTCLTTKQCLLNPNRNAQLSMAELEHKLLATLGVTRTLWLDEGLINDHTDGHIDTLARFFGPAQVLCMKPKDHHDPNFRVLQRIEDMLKDMIDAQGRRFKIVTCPSPGAVTDLSKRLMPASYLNFYIANSTVIVPTYGVATDAEAVATIAACFPDRQTVGLSAISILSGGGAFHCISQQEPK